MNYRIIDIDKWERKKYFEHYFSNVPCTYSVTVKLDITAIRDKKLKLYPTMLYLLTKTVNMYEEFRTAVNSKGDIVVFESMNPSFTIFHKDTETFSNIWSEYSESYAEFCENYENDLSLFGEIKEFEAKPNVPENIFPVSMIPWTTFESFNLNLQKGFDYLLPIFTMGKYELAEGKYLLPLSVTVHHGVCDGFHLCRFINKLQELCYDIAK